MPSSKLARTRTLNLTLTLTLAPALTLTLALTRTRTRTRTLARTLALTRTPTLTKPQAGKAGVPNGLIYSVEDIVADPQYNARGMIETLPVPELGRDLKVVGLSSRP